MATVNELKATARDLGLTFPAKIRKPELESLIRRTRAILPLTDAQRRAHYVKVSGKITARQSRRLRKKFNKNCPI